jgi:hypothetical protein
MVQQFWADHPIKQSLCWLVFQKLIIPGRFVIHKTLILDWQTPTTPHQNPTTPHQNHIKTKKKNISKTYVYGAIHKDTFLVWWTSIYQLSWGSLGTRVLTHAQMEGVSAWKWGFEMIYKMDLEGCLGDWDLRSSKTYRCRWFFRWQKSDGSFN